MTQETTRGSEPKILVSSDPQRQLLEQIEDLKRKLEGKDRKIAYLENLLSERLEITKKSYEDLKPYFEGMKAKLMDLFFEDHLRRYTYEEIIEKFRARYPTIPTTHLPRRLKEMVQEQKLVSFYDQERGRVVFHLKLFPDTRRQDNSIGSMANLNNSDVEKRLGEMSSEPCQNSDSHKKSSSESCCDPEGRERKEG